MLHSRKTGTFFAILAALILIPASGYALVDASVYGGYAFGGELDSGAGDTADVDGYHYGARAHVNLGIPLVFSVGAGLFYQIAPMEYEADGDSDDLTQKTLGIDAYAQLELPFLPVYPFVRYGIAIKDEVEVTYGSTTSTFEESFKSSYYGAGITYSLLDAVVIDIQLFAEYLYTTTKQEDDVELKGNAINIGVQAAM